MTSITFEQVDSAPWTPPPPVRLPAMLAERLPGPFFRDSGVPLRVAEPGHVESHLPGEFFAGRYGLQLDTVTIFDTPSVRGLRRTRRTETAWQFLQREFAWLHLDEVAAMELLRWLVWHGFIDEGLLTARDLPELAHSVQLRRPRKPCPQGFPPTEWRKMLYGMGEYAGYIGELNGMRAARIWTGQGYELDLAFWYGSVRFEATTLLGEGGRRYECIRSGKYWSKQSDELFAPTFLWEGMARLLYLAGGEDGIIYTHRLLLAGWMGAEMNVDGLPSKRKDDDHLQGHHVNGDTLDNRLVNTMPVRPIQHRVIHPNGW